MTQLTGETKKEIIDLIEVEGYSLLNKEAIPMIMKGEKIVHVTDHPLTLKHRKRIEQLIKGLKILNVKEEKIFLLTRNLKEKQARRLKKFLEKQANKK